MKKMYGFLLFMSMRDCLEFCWGMENITPGCFIEEMSFTVRFTNFLFPQLNSNLLWDLFPLKKSLKPLMIHYSSLQTNNLPLLFFYDCQLLWLMQKRVKLRS